MFAKEVNLHDMFITGQMPFMSAKKLSNFKS